MKSIGIIALLGLAQFANSKSTHDNSLAQPQFDEQDILNQLQNLAQHQQHADYPTSATAFRPSNDDNSDNTDNTDDTDNNDSNDSDDKSNNDNDSDSRDADTKKSISLAEAVAATKDSDACKLRYLNGAAVVMYGIPVYLNKE